jgi:hypothetical protein
MDGIDWMRVCLSGGTLSDTEAVEIDRALDAAPENLELRVKRLGYLCHRRLPRGLDVLWLAEHHPEVDLAGFACVEPEVEPEQYGRIREVWDAHLQARPDHPAILRRAAMFAEFGGDLDYAERLYRQGARIEPEQSRWSADVGRVLLQRSSELPGGARQTLADAALAEFERAYAIETWSLSKHILLLEIAKAAVVAGARERAIEAAKEALGEAPVYEGTGQYGNTLHWAHIVLGSVALLDGQIADASAMLIRAGRIPGSPQLDSFGPDLVLAQRLLDHGDRHAVETYLTDCQRFWTGDGGRLATALSQIRAGQCPQLDLDEGDVQS